MILRSLAVSIILFSQAHVITGAWAAPSSPNVLLIITDDQGYGDLACHGNPIIKTPNLDRLHAESVRFTNFHVDPTCSPTRGALMTGKYSHRAKVWHTIAGGNHLRASEMTMADVFKASGYRTAMFGKWHLGSNYPYRPMDRGFDEWLGQGDGGTGTTDCYFTNDRVNDHYLHNGEWEYREGYAPDLFFDAAIDFIKQPQAKQPFFIYLSTYMPHTPLTLPDRSWTDEYAKKVDQHASYFFAGIERIDQNIQRIRQALADSGQADNTIVIFMTDNGGTGGVQFFNAGMRGMKGQVYDGGHRVPFFIHWPEGRLQHGSDVADLSAHIDVLPTLIDLCKLTPPKQVDFDGRSFKSQLFEPEKLLPERTLCVEKQRTFTPQKWAGAAAMTRRWRLVDGKQLYDMTTDPGQRTDVAQKHPEVVERLKQDFDAYWQRVSPGDRDRVTFIVGHPNNPETFLQPMDWYLPKPPWNHEHVAKGVKQTGSWSVSAAETGLFRFEARRWPAEVDAPISAVPKLKKKIDAWDDGGGKPTLIYANQQSPFTALPVAYLRLQVGTFVEVKPVGPEDTMIAFDVPLEGGQQYKVQAELLDENNEVIAGAYYVYCRKIQ